MDSQTQKLLGAVVKNTQMCQTTLNKLIGITKDAELKKKIHEQLATREDIANRARAMLERTADRAGYMLGSGNSIPEYVPHENYLAMIRAALDMDR